MITNEGWVLSPAFPEVTRKADQMGFKQNTFSQTQDALEHLIENAVKSATDAFIKDQQKVLGECSDKEQEELRASFEKDLRKALKDQTAGFLRLNSFAGKLTDPAA